MTDWHRSQNSGLSLGLGLELLASAFRHSGLGLEVLASASNQNLSSCFTSLRTLLIICYTQDQADDP